ncbi:MAG: aminopeptidase [Woeseiaceae bacterium]|nr:aminopeptidase [Woeseiaceae bacterium]
MTRTRRRHRQALRVACVLPLLVVLEGCYYMQAARGQLEIWQRREPIGEVIADPATDERLAQQLQMLRAARQFASEELHLPDNGSYRSYADLERDYVVWNVIAAPEFSLQPRTWCYLFVGCLAYRGYFSPDAAADQADALRADGYDVYVGGVAAYSTLGRFDDPLLNTMMSRSDADLVALLFHELAHQVLYVDDDTAFNESFASAVAELGLVEWLAARGEQGELERWRQRQAQLAEVMRRVDATRDRLADLYAEPLPEDVMRRRKAALLENLRRDASGKGNDWLAGALNNARLVALTMYRGQVPAFRRLFARCERDWACFSARPSAWLTCRPKRATRRFGISRIASRLLARGRRLRRRQSAASRSPGRAPTGGRTRVRRLVLPWMRQWNIVSAVITRRT